MGDHRKRKNRPRRRSLSAQDRLMGTRIVAVECSDDPQLEEAVLAALAGLAIVEKAGMRTVWVADNVSERREREIRRRLPNVRIESIDASLDPAATAVFLDTLVGGVEGEGPVFGASFPISFA